MALALLVAAPGADAQEAANQRKTMIFGVVPSDPRPVEPSIVAGPAAAPNQGPAVNPDGTAVAAVAGAAPPAQQGLPGWSGPSAPAGGNQGQAPISPAAPANGNGTAMPAVQAGLLECRGAFATGYGFGSSRHVTCTFQPPAGEVHYYVGTLDRVGLDIGVSDQASMLWAVLATSPTIHPGALAGKYVGVSSGFALGPGFSANMLASADASAQITLQPLSVSSDSGLSLSITGATLTLVSSAQRPR